jgi:alpha-ketoglutarate-dependent taurine dioxygenase
MKIKLGEIRKAIHEEYMRGVPEFILQELTHTYIEGVRKHVQKHIQMTQKSPAEAREAIKIANETLKSLEDKANQLLEDALWQYVQRT